MSHKAVVSYLLTLRLTTKPRLTQYDIAYATGADQRSVLEWEKGRAQPTTINAHKYLRAVGGSAEQLHRLAIDDHATAEDGERAAHIWRVIQTSRRSLSDPETVADIVSRLSPTAAAELIRLLQVL